MKIRRIIPILTVVLLVSHCVKLSPLAPLAQDSTPQFGAGDTTYILVSPVWDHTYGFEAPVEISIARDGHVFVADTGAQSIWVLDQSGVLQPGFEALTGITTFDGDHPTPIDVDVDSKMNVLFIDGSNRVYDWNQIWNSTGLEAYAESGDFVEDNTGNTIHAAAGTPEWFELANTPGWSLENVQWSSASSVLDSLLAVHVLFDGNSLTNQLADLYYSSTASRFSALSTTENNDNYFFVTDEAQDRIIRIKMEHALWVRTPDGDEFWTHRGVFNGTVAQYGTGSGTVNQPVGLDVDYSGSIYYSQLGEYFSVHKIKPVTTGGYTVYSSVFQPGINPIMDLGRFDHPLDVAVDRNQMIYVANTGAREIQVFDYQGKLFKKAGVEKVVVDTTLWVSVGTDSVLVDTFVTHEVAGFLESPSALTVDDQGVIYVCDPPTSRIVRYQLSNTLDENIVSNP
ncbi:MAG: hypothetical protein D6762_07265 [Candidatus Neomarinimicrobiota bacterium]|nr:MAG: hypothetical protein D6762_07265 [Candidatus Neomarinimicrobiota bacterium]